VKKLVLLFIAASFATPAASEIIGVKPERKWTYISSGKSVVYGTPETDDVVLRISCPDGIDQLTFEFVYDFQPTPWDSLRKRKPDPLFPHHQPSGPVLIKVDGKNVLAGTSGEIKKFEFGDELQGWNVVLQDTKWDIEKILKMDGVVTVSTGADYDEGKFVTPPVAQYKIALKGAQAAITRLRSACR